MSFYVRTDEDRFESTLCTRGPWDAGSQHAGPPAALLGRAVARRAREGLRLGRITFDIARPVPIAPLTVTTSVVRSGRSVEVIEAAIEPFMRATALMIREAPGAAPEVLDPPRVPPVSAAIAKPFFPTDDSEGYHTAMEVLFAKGSFLERGPAIAWMRMRVPLIEGEPIDPLSRVLVAADSGNGVSNLLDFSEHVFINADLTVNLVRYPSEEWVCLEARTLIDGDGIGLATSTLHDETGPIGHATQCLFVNLRS